MVQAPRHPSCLTVVLSLDDICIFIYLDLPRTLEITLCFILVSHLYLFFFFFFFSLPPPMHIYYTYLPLSTRHQILEYQVKDSLSI